mmetsp:Transcript_817/g.1878  ORF Transcript_817/g.1878 Transcript_817/m.1878 type:complete len:336 (+) Transcript_817:519-1526(+)
MERKSSARRNATLCWQDWDTTRSRGVARSGQGWKPSGAGCRLRTLLDRRGPPRLQVKADTSRSDSISIENWLPRRTRCFSTAAAACRPSSAHSAHPACPGACVTSIRSPIRSCTATSAPGGTASQLTTTVGERASPASAPPRVTSTSDRRVPRGTSNMRITPSTTAMMKMGAAAVKESSPQWSMSGVCVCEPKSPAEALSALTSGDSNESHAACSPLLPNTPAIPAVHPALAPPKLRLSSWLWHCAWCVGNGHGHGEQTSAYCPPPPPVPAPSRAPSARHLLSASLPCQLSMNRAHATCSSIALCVASDARVWNVASPASCAGASEGDGAAGDSL